MSQSEYVLVLKFHVKERLPSYSGMEGYVPGFVDSFFERHSTRVNHNAMEIWVRVDKPKYEDTLDSLNRMKKRMDTPREELKHYESSISLSSEDVTVEHMKSNKYTEQTEHSASIVNDSWEDIVFNVIDENEISFILQQDTDTDVLISISKYKYKNGLREKHNFNKGQQIRATVKSRSGAGNNWNIESMSPV